MDISRLLCWLLVAYQIILFARVILSWVGRSVPDALRPLVAFVYAATEPVMKVFRPLIPPLRMGAVALDISILLVFILLSVLQTAICR